MIIESRQAMRHLAETVSGLMTRGETLQRLIDKSSQLVTESENLAVRSHELDGKSRQRKTFIIKITCVASSAVSVALFYWYIASIAAEK